MFSSPGAVGESSYLSLEGLVSPWKAHGSVCLQPTELDEWIQTKVEKPSAACPYDSMVTLVNTD